MYKIDKKTTISLVVLDIDFEFVIWYNFIIIVVEEERFLSTLFY